MTSFWRDVRYALRLFARERVFTAMAVLTLPRFQWTAR